MSGKLFLISASSGAGKTTLIKELVKKAGDAYPLKIVVGCTSRPPRPGEREGVDYYFLSEEIFKKKIAAGDFLEWSFGYGYYYGTLRDILDDVLHGKSVVAVIGVRAIEMALQGYSRAVPLWITVSNIETLENRLRARNMEKEVLEERLRVARAEFEWIKTTTLFQHIIMNDHLDRAVNQLFEITCKTN